MKLYVSKEGKNRAFAGRLMVLMLIMYFIYVTYEYEFSILLFIDLMI